MKGQVKDRTICKQKGCNLPLTMCKIQYTEVHIFPINK